MPVMYVLHVSRYNLPMNSVRLVVGCEDSAVSMAKVLLNKGYNVWETEEEFPERSREEMELVQQLLKEVFEG